MLIARVLENLEEDYEKQGIPIDEHDKIKAIIKIQRPYEVIKFPV